MISKSESEMLMNRFKNEMLMNRFKKEIYSFILAEMQKYNRNVYNNLYTDEEIAKIANEETDFILTLDDVYNLITDGNSFDSFELSLYLEKYCERTEPFRDIIEMGIVPFSSDDPISVKFQPFKSIY